MDGTCISSSNLADHAQLYQLPASEYTAVHMHPEADLLMNSIASTRCCRYTQSEQQSLGTGQPPPNTCSTTADACCFCLPSTLRLLHALLQVLPSADEYGRAFTTVRFVVSNRNPELATNLLASLNEEKTQNNLKNRIEELRLDMIGDSMKAQTPTDYKAAARGTSGVLPSSTMMDTTGGLNGVAAAAAGGVGMAGPAGATPLPGTAAAGGNATSTAGLPGMPAGGTTSTLAERRRQNSGASGVTAGALLPLLLAAGAMLL
jgi:hypothetical protein